MHYDVDDAASAYVMLVQQYGQTVNNYILDVSQSQHTINVANFQPGIYNVVLVCDGQVRDTKTLTVN